MELSRDVFLTFSWMSHLKHLLLRAFLEDCLPEMLSKVGVLAERSMKKSKKGDSSSGTGRLWRSGSALGGSGGDFRRYVLRTSSPELVKSIPNAPRKYARAFVYIFDGMLCAQ